MAIVRSKGRSGVCRMDAGTLGYGGNVDIRFLAPHVGPLGLAFCYERAAKGTPSLEQSL